MGKCDLCWELVSLILCLIFMGAGCIVWLLAPSHDIIDYVIMPLFNQSLFNQSLLNVTSDLSDV